jgi:hypothetical protein
MSDEKMRVTHMSETRTQSRTPRVRVTGVDMMGSSKRSESKQSSELADQISFFISSREYKMPAQLSSSSPTPAFPHFENPKFTHPQALISTAPQFLHILNARGSHHCYQLRLRRVENGHAPKPHTLCPANLASLAKPISRYSSTRRESYSP